jgi:hypothetical protein
MPGGELRVAFKIPYMYDYITKLCRTQAELIVNHADPNVHCIAQGKGQPLHRQRGGPILK